MCAALMPHVNSDIGCVPGGTLMCQNTSPKCTTAIPPYVVSFHTTRFGGERNDVLIISFEEHEPAGLRTPLRLADLVEAVIPSFASSTLELLIHLRSIYVTHIQIPPEPLNSEGRGAGRRRERAKRLGAGNDVTLTAPRLTERINASGCETSSETLLPKATLSVRIHLIPQRFPLVPLLQWKRRLLRLTSDFAFVNKPGGLPCEPVASNYVECVHVQVGLALLGSPLKPLNRIDLWTTGVVALSRYEKASRWFNLQQVERHVFKTYRLLGAFRAPAHVTPLEQLGLNPNAPLPQSLEHWMPPSSAFNLAAPRIVSRLSIPRWKHCITKIKKIVEYTNLDALFFDNTCEGASLGFLNEMRNEIHRLLREGFRLIDVEVALVTGRTHQLRAQFSACGVPLVCDWLYMPLSGFSVDPAKLCPERIVNDLDFNELVTRGDNITRCHSASEALQHMTLSQEEVACLDRLKATKKLTCPIGLQASILEMPKYPSSSDGENQIADIEDRLVVEAGPPWWCGGQF